MGPMMLRGLYWASVCLLDALGLTDLYQLYSMLLMEFGPRDSDGSVPAEDEFPDC